MIFMTHLGLLSRKITSTNYHSCRVSHFRKIMKNHEKFIKDNRYIVLKANKLFNQATFPTYLVKKAIINALYGIKSDETIISFYFQY